MAGDGAFLGWRGARRIPGVVRACGGAMARGRGAGGGARAGSWPACQRAKAVCRQWIRRSSADRIRACRIVTSPERAWRWVAGAAMSARMADNCWAIGGDGFNCMGGH